MNRNSYKLIIYTILLVFVIVGCSFFIGSFYPNKWTTDKITKEFHKKEVSEVIYLGLIQPEFDYNDKQTFIEATGKCVDYLNFTTD